MEIFATVLRVGELSFRMKNIMIVDLYLTLSRKLYKIWP